MAPEGRRVECRGSQRRLNYRIKLEEALLPGWGVLFEIFRVGRQGRREGPPPVLELLELRDVGRADPSMGADLPERKLPCIHALIDDRPGNAEQFSGSLGRDLVLGLEDKATPASATAVSRLCIARSSEAGISAITLSPSAFVRNSPPCSSTEARSRKLAPFLACSRSDSSTFSFITASVTDASI